MEEYAPGWTADALAMMGSRTADARAAAVRPYLPGARLVVDVGCGPGTITRDLAAAVAPDGCVLGVDRHVGQLAPTTDAAREEGVRNLRFAQGSVYDLPVRTGAADLVFAHAIVEHLARPDDALAELHRVLRDDGVLVVCSSDWSGAVLDPRTRDVDDALAGHYLLRRLAGGDPFAGGRLPDLVAAAGFTSVRTVVDDRVDMAYAELARYVGTRVTAARPGADAATREVLGRAADAADRWATTDGTFVQRWVEVVARRTPP